MLRVQLVYSSQDPKVGWEQHLYLQDAQAKVEESRRVLVRVYDD